MGPLAESVAMDGHEGGSRWWTTLGLPAEKGGDAEEMEGGAGDEGVETDRKDGGVALGKDE